MDDIQKVLIKKAFKSNLAHFYILEPSTTRSKDSLVNWCQELVYNTRVNFGDKISLKHIKNHQDVLFIDTENKNYNLDEFDEFFKFLHYGPSVFNYKYVFISEGNKIAQRLANKLLKTLEEPQIPVCIILINSNKAKLLDTIISRAMTLRLNIANEPLRQDLTLPEDHINLALKIKKDPDLELAYQELLFSYLNKKNISIEKIEEIKSYFSEYKLDKEYNNPQAARIYKLYTLIDSMQKI